MGSPLLQPPSALFFMFYAVHLSLLAGMLLFWPRAPLFEVYAPDCSVTFTTIINDTFLDFWIIPHFFGWFVATLFCGDWKMGFLLSLVDEAVELSFDRWLPPFRECWWDHMVDIFIFNLFGCLLAQLVINYFKMTKRNWWEGKDVMTTATYISLILFFRYLQFSLPFAYKTRMNLAKTNLFFAYHTTACIGIASRAYIEHYERFKYNTKVPPLWGIMAFGHLFIEYGILIILG